MADVQVFTFNLFREHTMTARETGSPTCVVVDPGFYSPEEENTFLSSLEASGTAPEAILVTHCHIDHIWGAASLQRRYGIPLYMAAYDAGMEVVFGRMCDRLGLRVPDFSFSVTPVKDGDIIAAAGLRFKAITTPGHSPEGVCYLEENSRIMFTGDTLFAGTIGRTDLVGGEYDDLIRSIMEKLIWLDPGITIYPGHGGTSTIGVERTSNPFLEPFNEPEESSAGSE